MTREEVALGLDRLRGNAKTMGWSDAIPCIEEAIAILTTDGECLNGLRADRDEWQGAAQHAEAKLARVRSEIAETVTVRVHQSATPLVDHIAAMDRALSEEDGGNQPKSALQTIMATRAPRSHLLDLLKWSLPYVGPFTGTHEDIAMVLYNEIGYRCPCGYCNLPHLPVASW